MNHNYGGDQIRRDMKKTLAILGHTDVNSVCGTLARNYAEAPQVATGSVTGWGNAMKSLIT